jgi:hypothetical protein
MQQTRSFRMRLRWSKMTAFLGFASKDFGELGSLFERSEFEQVPKVCEQNRQECSFFDRSTHTKTSPIELEQTPNRAGKNTTHAPPPLPSARYSATTKAPAGEMRGLVKMV